MSGTRIITIEDRRKMADALLKSKIGTLQGVIILGDLGHETSVSIAGISVDFIESAIAALWSTKAQIEAEHEAKNGATIN